MSLTPERIQQMAWGYAPPFIIEAALRHHIFDVLAEGAKTVSAVASESGASVRGLRIVMNALVGLQLLSKDEHEAYSLTPESAEYLVSGRPTYVGGTIRHTSRQLVPKWLHLAEIVQTGAPEKGVNQETEGSAFFREFVEDIFPRNYPSAKHLADVLEVASAQAPVRVLDLAAGSGVWGIALAQKSPRVTVTAVDWPDVLDVTRRVTARYGLEDRYSYVAGDLQYAEFGTGHNIATLGQILHSEGEERSRALLRKTFAAMAPGGTIAVAEFLVNDGRSAPLGALIFAVNMLVATQNGDTFTFAEISEWLKAAGFENPRTVESAGPSPLILADRP